MKFSKPKTSASSVIASASLLIVCLLVLNALPEDSSEWITPLILIIVFVLAAMERPPVAIAILLYTAMTSGGWLILVAAPGTMLLARRYQRLRQKIELSPTHIRRTVLLAMATLVAALPFLSSAAGAWSNNGRSRPSSAASPLVPESQPGEEGLLQRFARWLGFGDDPVGPRSDGEPLRPRPVRPEPPDDPFNWWILAAVAVAVVLAALAWWLWRRRKQRALPIMVAESARPLARLEAVGASIGRPREMHEGAITYGQVLAHRTGDSRLGDAGPLVSGQVYQSAFADTARVDTNLSGIEAAPPPAPPKPSFGARITSQIERLPFTPRGLIIGAVGIVVAILAGWLIIPRLGDLDDDQRFGRSAASPAGAIYLDGG